MLYPSCTLYLCICSHFKKLWVHCYLLDTIIQLTISLRWRCKEPIICHLSLPATQIHTHFRSPDSCPANKVLTMYIESQTREARGNYKCYISAWAQSTTEETQALNSSSYIQMLKNLRRWSGSISQQWKTFSFPWGIVIGILIKLSEYPY